VLARTSQPPFRQAAIDGWAVVAASVEGASKRKPVALPESSILIDRGAVLPAAFDAVMPLGGVLVRPTGPAALRGITPGDGVADAASRVREGDLLIRGGERINSAVALAATVCGITEVIVRRPVVDIIFNAPGIMRQQDHYLPMLISIIRSFSSEIGSIRFTAGDAGEFASAVLGSAADVVVTIGGTGTGPGDTTAEALRSVGEVVFHGVLQDPGGTTGFAVVGGKPVLLVPGNLTDILGVLIVLAPVFARRLFGKTGTPTLPEARLLSPIAPSKTHTQVVFGNLSKDGITVIGGASLRPAELTQINVAMVVSPGERYKRVGERIRFSAIPVSG
jgi:molybdopterin molybdotransferase